jgi:hypothetical protein
MGDDWFFVLIVSTLILAAIVGSVLKTLFRSAPQTVPDPSTRRDLQRLDEEMKSMKDRLAVLERIATDEGRLLGEEIERLRQMPPPRSLQGSAIE